MESVEGRVKEYLKAAALDGSQILRGDLYKTVMSETEEVLLKETYKALFQNKSLTARVLGISRPALIKKLRDYGVQD